MKLNILFFLLLFTFNLMQSQEESSKVITKYIITHASHNDIDVTEDLLKEKSYLVLYKNIEPELEADSEEMFFANVWDVSDSQSYGRIFNMDSSQTPETEESYRTSILNFNWSYQNSYNDESGTAKVKVFNIFKPAGITFTITIVTEDLDFFTYKGYVDGSLNSSISKQIKDNQFNRIYNKVRTFDEDTNAWSEWAEGKNTFIFNFNSNNGIKHILANGEEFQYQKISEVKEGIADDGYSYEEILVKDEDGLRFGLQLFNESSKGLMMIYKDIIFHFSAL
jgi:hypothetical protein